jgi:hypothetical protein
MAQMQSGAQTQSGRRFGYSSRPGRSLAMLVGILRLDAGDGDVAALRQAIANSRIDWDGVVMLAQRQLLAPALWPALLSKNLAAPMPPALRTYLAGRGAGQGQNVMLALADMHRDNAARNERIRAQVLAAIGLLNAAGIEPAALKGTRILLVGDPDLRSLRCLRDIDLVIAPGDWQGACAALRAGGYRDRGVAPHALSFTPAGEGVEIDLHRRPLSLHAPAYLPVYLSQEGFWPHTIAMELPGLRCRHLPASESLVHAILHTEVADLNFAAGDWALRYLYETAVLSRQPAPRLDWSVMENLADSGLRLALRAHLHAAWRLFGARLPSEFAADWRSRRHFLRCLANARHPRTLRRVNILVHKLRQAMAPWYLRRKGFYDEEADSGPGLWRARARALAGLMRLHARRLPKLLFGADDDGLPPPRV